MTPVRQEPAAHPSRVKHSITEPLRFQFGPVVQEEMPLKDFLSRALAVPLFSGPEPFAQFW